MMHSESIATIAKALVAAQADIRAVEKSAINPHFRSKYVPLDAIISMARPALAAHGMAIVQAGTPFDDGKGLLVETRLIHTSGEWLSGVVYIPFGKADPQGAGAAMTYGRRFGLSALLSISSDEDDDGNSASRGARESGRAAKRSATATTQPTVTAPTPPPVLTRDSVVPFAPKLRSGMAPTVKELPLDFLQWACEPGRKLGQHTETWQAFLQSEIDARESGDVGRVTT